MTNSNYEQIKAEREVLARRFRTRRLECLRLQQALKQFYSAIICLGIAKVTSLRVTH